MKNLDRFKIVMITIALILSQYIIVLKCRRIEQLEKLVQSLTESVGITRDVSKCSVCDGTCIYHFDKEKGKAMEAKIMGVPASSGN